MRQIEPSATLLLNEQSRQMAQNGQNVYKFGFGQSPFLPPDFVQEALRTNAHRKEYTAVQGLPALREAVAAFHSAWQGISVTADQVMVAPGSKSLLFTILATFQPAHVLIPAPAWVSYAPQAQMLGHSVARLNTDFERRWRIHPAQLAEHRKAGCDNILVLNYPGNPDGLTYSAEEIEALAEAARQLGMWVISDEIYALLTYNDTHVSFARAYPECTFTTSGLSKWCGAGGWRLGVTLLPADFPDVLKQTMLGIASETYSCAPTPIQLAAIAAYESLERVTPYLHIQRRVLQQIGQFCATALSDAGVNVHEASGGFYLFPDFMPFQETLARRNIHTSADLCTTLLQETGVALLPAIAFGFAPSYLAARLAFVDFEDPHLENADDFRLSQHAPQIVEGIQKLCDWLV